MPSSLLPPRHGWKHPAVTGRHHPRTARTPRTHAGRLSFVGRLFPSLRAPDAMPSSLLPPRHGWKHPAVTGRHHPRTARTPRNHTGCASLVHNRVQRVDLLQTSAFFPPCFPPANPPSPSHGFHSRSILLPVGSRFFCWAASSWLLWSSGGIIVVAMVFGRHHRGCYGNPFTVPPSLPSTKAARPTIYQSRPKNRLPLAHPPTSFHRRNFHSPLVLRGYYGRAVYIPLVAPRYARPLETKRTLISNLVGVCSTDINFRHLHQGNPDCAEVSDLVNES